MLQICFRRSQLFRAPKYDQEHFLKPVRVTNRGDAMPYAATHKAETRARIVQSARRLFNRHGFTEVSIDEIMSAAGLTRGGFYNHFAKSSTPKR